MRIIRIYFTKQDEASYISHLDLQRVMARGLRMSGLPVWYSQGFNPHIYMNFALPLPLMHQSRVECVDCKTESELEDFSQFVQPLSRALPRGIEVTHIGFPKFGTEKITHAQYLISCREAGRFQEAVEQYNQSAQVTVLRTTKRSQQEIDLKEILPALIYDEEGLSIKLPAGSAGHINPDLLLGYFEKQQGLTPDTFTVLRTKIYADQDEIFS